MDDTAVTTRTDRPMTLTGGAGALTPDPAIVDPAEHNIVFTSLVTSDKDIVGLVAYSIYKQNKYDWLHAFSRLQGRMPDEAEAQSYLLRREYAAAARNLPSPRRSGAGRARPRRAERRSAVRHRPMRPGSVDRSRCSRRRACN